MTKRQEATFIGSIIKELRKQSADLDCGLVSINLSVGMHRHNGVDAQPEVLWRSYAHGDSSRTAQTLCDALQLTREAMSPKTKAPVLRQAAAAMIAQAQELEDEVPF